MSMWVCRQAISCCGRRVVRCSCCGIVAILQRLCGAVFSWRCGHGRCLVHGRGCAIQSGIISTCDAFIRVNSCIPDYTWLPKSSTLTHLYSQVICFYFKDARAKMFEPFLTCVLAACIAHVRFDSRDQQAPKPVPQVIQLLKCLQ